MTPSAATPAARSHPRRPARTGAPQRTRRVSGPVRKPGRAGIAAGRVPAGVVPGPPLGLRLLRRAARLLDAPALDRLARGRLWIGLLAAGLVGVVFLQISLLELNTGISRAVQTEQTLERQNTALKLDLSRLAGGQRVQDSAAAMGFVAPVTGQPRFLDAKAADAERAAASITVPAPVRQLPLGMIAPGDGGTAGVPGAPGAPGASPAPVDPAPGAAGAAAPSGAQASATPQPTAPAAAPHEDHAAPPAATGGIDAAGGG